MENWLLSDKDKVSGALFICTQMFFFFWWNYFNQITKWLLTGFSIFFSSQTQENTKIQLSLYSKFSNAQFVQIKLIKTVRAC